MKSNNKLSGYTTTYNCIKSEYPWKDSIQSLLGFCDEVIVLDGGSDDGTWEELLRWADIEDKLVVNQHTIDWKDERFAYQSDGAQKARARSFCSGNWCWQSDVDEVVKEEDYQKVRDLLEKLPDEIDILCLPVIEYWGNKGKVRVDVNPWKWRLSRNKSHITHGIPASHRRYDDQNRLYAAEGTDGCNYIHMETYENLPAATFYSQEMENIRQAANAGQEQFLTIYKDVLQHLINNMPVVYHYSWYNLERKIKNYRDYWSKFWCSLYNKTLEDTAENNMMFDKPWLEVSDKEIKELAQRLETEMGGWIFHRKIDWDQKTNWITL
jgi:glycosyltransferase involved in cell wall biosynthesis